MRSFSTGDTREGLGRDTTIKNMDHNYSHQPHGCCLETVMYFETKEKHGVLAGYDGVTEVEDEFKKESDLCISAIGGLGGVKTLDQSGSADVNTETKVIEYGKTAEGQLSCSQADGKKCSKSPGTTKVTHLFSSSVGNRVPDGQVTKAEEEVISPESSKLPHPAGYRPPPAVEGRPAEISQELSGLPLRKNPPKLYCVVCDEVVFSKNMARHKMSRRHSRRSLVFRSHDSENQPPSHPTVRVMCVPESVVKELLPPHLYDKLSHTLLQYGFKLGA